MVDCANRSHLPTFHQDHERETFPDGAEEACLARSIRHSHHFRVVHRWSDNHRQALVGRGCEILLSSRRQREHRRQALKGLRPVESILIDSSLCSKRPKAHMAACVLSSHQGPRRLPRLLGLVAHNHLQALRRFLEGSRRGPSPVVSVDEGTSDLQGSTLCCSSLAGLRIGARGPQFAVEVPVEP